MSVDNTIYDHLGERWYTAQDDPVALLRAESRGRLPWVLATLHERLGVGPAKVLDLGCGAGFLSNALALAGHQVTAVDASAESLAVARRYDASGRVNYVEGDAFQVPQAQGQFDAVFAMDFLEHVEDPGALIQRAASHVRPGGVFFFHTFNKNWLSWLVVIKGVEWFVRNVPKDLHVLHNFVRPADLKADCLRASLHVQECFGFVPNAKSWAFWRMLATGRVSEDFNFIRVRSVATGYSGYAIKTGSSLQSHKMAPS